jgi:4-alpha-glucanotransferase
VIGPIQDVFGWRDRINQPATVDDRNWSFQLPWRSDRLNDVPEAAERQGFLRTLSARYGRV